MRVRRYACHRQDPSERPTRAAVDDRRAVAVRDPSDEEEALRDRHGHIVALLGIKDLVLTVNKMDLIDYIEA